MRKFLLIICLLASNAVLATWSPCGKDEQFSSAAAVCQDLVKKQGDSYEYSHMENQDELTTTCYAKYKGGSGSPDIVGSACKIDDIELVDENAHMSDEAREYQDSAEGARSNAETRKGQAPSLNRTLPDGKKRPVRFDGVDGKVMIDRKISIYTTKKAKNAAKRQSQALAENNLKGRWEVPNQAEANRAQKIFDELGIKNISVKVVPK